LARLYSVPEEGQIGEAAPYLKEEDSMAKLYRLPEIEKLARLYLVPEEGQVGEAVKCVPDIGQVGEAVLSTLGRTQVSKAVPCT
jgi:hypothetical protein